MIVIVISSDYHFQRNRQNTTTRVTPFIIILLLLSSSLSDTVNAFIVSRYHTSTHSSRSTDAETRIPITRQIQQQQRHHRVLLSLSSSSHFGSMTENNNESFDDRVEKLGILLPPAPKAAANYVPIQRCGNMLYLAGHLPFHEDGITLYLGKIGSHENSVEYGYKAARQCGLNLIASLRHYLGGTLSDIIQIVKIFGIVQSDENFHEQHKVLNGCSDLMVEVFGNPVGIHARSAIGTNALPLNISVEVEMIVQIKDK